jgi:hypothetical protein
MLALLQLIPLFSLALFPMAWLVWKTESDKR